MKEKGMEAIKSPVIASVAKQSSLRVRQSQSGNKTRVFAGIPDCFGLRPRNDENAKPRRGDRCITVYKRNAAYGSRGNRYITLDGDHDRRGGVCPPLTSIARVGAKNFSPSTDDGIMSRLRLFHFQFSILNFQFLKDCFVAALLAMTRFCCLCGVCPRPTERPENAKPRRGDRCITLSKVQLGVTKENETSNAAILARSAEKKRKPTLNSLVFTLFYTASICARARMYFSFICKLKHTVNKVSSLRDLMRSHISFSIFNFQLMKFSINKDKPEFSRKSGHKESRHN
jgi:hypothetical protein